eukprot:gnl/MRDRNA2_/MRDRNA2_80993_c1_seq1.p1 gnl/MRDRNA2_/MRDRNA2_80993_c1~~gnl/MRDRNA2_/MRDRNA2_80993_c1_seq1.p1  ORF type:complete len:117 (+),score=27.19 gnl/MRDRNA2_/MRDRNA2_80993_c1_seq1:447-797(+)
MTGMKDKALFAALAVVTQRHMKDFKSQGLANTAWAFAAASQYDVLMFALLATAAEQVMGARAGKDGMHEVNTQELTNTTWAFSKVGQSHAQFFATLAQNAKCHIETYGEQEVGSIA